MLCVPEGGMSYDWDLTYIIDGMPERFRADRIFILSYNAGMTTVEHALPVPVLYDDEVRIETANR